MDSPKRKSPRLKDFDYSSPGYYFITICTKDKKKVLSHIVDGGYLNVGEGLRARPQVKLTPIGKKVESAILKIELLYSDVSVDKYVIMPNHIHMIIIKHPDNSQVTGGHGDPPLQKESIGIDNVIGRLKSYTSHKHPTPLWQRSFHDHIIRGEKDYRKIWEYIDTNPSNWESDCFYT